MAKDLGLIDQIQTAINTWEIQAKALQMLITASKNYVRMLKEDD